MAGNFILTGDKVESPAVFVQRLNSRITRLEEALGHLLEVQTAPSFHEGEDIALYALQAEEWLHAVEDARRVLRGSL